MLILQLHPTQHTSTPHVLFPNNFSSTFNNELLLISQPVTDSLENEVWSCVDGLAHIVVGGKRVDLGPAAGPHRPAVQRMHRLAQTHDRRADVSHSESFNRLPILLLEREEEEEHENPNCLRLQCQDIFTAGGG